MTFLPLFYLFDKVIKSWGIWELKNGPALGEFECEISSAPVHIGMIKWLSQDSSMSFERVENLYWKIRIFNRLDVFNFLSKT